MFRDRRSPVTWGSRRAAPETRTRIGETGAINQLIVFGDSFSDTGAGYVDGNGPTAVYYLARAFGLDLIPANAASINRAASRNYAISGAGSDASPGGLIRRHMLGRGFLAQVEDFEEDLRSQRLIIDRDTAIYIAIGLNERGRTTEETVANLTHGIERLYAAGARTIVLARIPELLPDYPDVGQRLNPAYEELARRLRAHHPDLRCVMSDWGRFFDEILDRPGRFGIANVTDPCTPGRALFGEDVTVCPTPERYFYYHPGHPSAATHRLVGERLAEEMRALLRSCKVGGRPSDHKR